MRRSSGWLPGRKSADCGTQRLRGHAGVAQPAHRAVDECLRAGDVPARCGVAVVERALRDERGAACRVVVGGREVAELVERIGPGLALVREIVAVSRAKRASRVRSARRSRPPSACSIRLLTGPKPVSQRERDSRRHLGAEHEVAAGPAHVQRLADADRAREQVLGERVARSRATWKWRLRSSQGQLAIGQVACRSPPCAPFRAWRPGRPGSAAARCAVPAGEAAACSARAGGSRAPWRPVPVAGCPPGCRPRASR